MNALSKTKLGSMLVLSLMSAGAFASTTGAEFKSASDKVIGWTNGYLGLAIAIVALLFGVIGGVFKGTLVGIALGFGTALALTIGPTVITGIFSAVI